MAKKYRLEQISPKDIGFNRENPRGERPEEIYRDKAFEQLKDSVAQFGVLVPVVVHENKGAIPKYILVDGERRLRAALATNTEEIPAHIASSEDKMGEIVQAFHIHMLRKQWKPVAIARAFKRIKKELKRNKKWTSDKELLQELQAKTGCTNKQLEDLERAIHYSPKVLKDVQKQFNTLPLSAQMSIAQQRTEDLDDKLFALQREYNREIADYQFNDTQDKAEFELNMKKVDQRL